MRAEPIVNGLKKEWDGRVQVVQVNVHAAGVRPLLQQLDFRFTPTFVLFDRQGEEAWRSVGVLDAAEARQVVAHLP